MTSGKVKFIVNLEKIKAGLGAAGMAAVGFETLAPRIAGMACASILAGPVGTIGTVAVAIASGIAAAHFTEISEKEAKLESEALKASVQENASN